MWSPPCFCHSSRRGPCAQFTASLWLLVISRVTGLSQQGSQWGHHEPPGVHPLSWIPRSLVHKLLFLTALWSLSAGQAPGRPTVCPPPGHPPPGKGWNVLPGSPQSEVTGPPPLICQYFPSVGSKRLQTAHVVLSVWRIWGSKALKYLRKSWKMPILAMELQAVWADGAPKAAGLCRRIRCGASGCVPCTAQGNTAQGNTTLQHRAGQHNIIQRNSAQGQATQYNTTQLSTGQHNTAQHNTTQGNSAQGNTTQRNTTQHRATQHRATQHSTTQHNTTQLRATQHVSTGPGSTAWHRAAWHRPIVHRTSSGARGGLG